MKFTVKVPADGSKINMECIEFELVEGSTNEWFSPIIENGVPIEPSSVVILFAEAGCRLSINNEEVHDAFLQPCVER